MGGGGVERREEGFHRSIGMVLREKGFIFNWGRDFRGIRGEEGRENNSFQNNSDVDNEIIASTALLPLATVLL